MNVEQMSVADLLREGKQAMALAMGSVGPDTRVRWEAVMAEIDLRLSVGDLDEDDLEGRVPAAVKAATETAVIAVAEKRAAMDELAKVIAERDRALQQISNNATNLQFVQDDSHGAPVIKEVAHHGKEVCCLCKGRGWRQNFDRRKFHGKLPPPVQCGLCKGTGWMTPPPKKP